MAGDYPGASQAEAGYPGAYEAVQSDCIGSWAGSYRGAINPCEVAMTIHALPNLDIEKFRKVYALVSGGATDGERASAKARAEEIAKKAGLTLSEAVSKMDIQPKQKSANFFEGFDDYMEQKHPGWKAERAKEKAERDIRENARRAIVLEIYGSEKALFARNEREAKLEISVEHLASWSYETDDDGTEYRIAASLDGVSEAFWRVDDITSAIRKAVMSAYPWPSNLGDALKEVKDWDRLRLDRALFCGGEWNHHSEVECRISLLEHALTEGQPATSWQDVQARFDWHRYEEERQWIDPTERHDPFMDRIEADFAILRSLYENSGSQSAAVQTGRRTNADKRAAVLSILDTEPELSDREIARRVGVSPQTANNWRRRTVKDGHSNYARAN
ncbi:helix-turn-helix domain-containing protein [Ochrobactrum teleogrylli]|uniref:helix-turn-helix domain-containing protein n=1 Tax=Ochrobactrum teleogrylli TaxID=2479765 RepID=UPI00384C0ECD